MVEVKVNIECIPINGNTFQSLHQHLDRLQLKLNNFIYNCYINKNNNNKNNKNTIVFTHGFGANALSFEPIMTYFLTNNNKILVGDMIAYDTYGFGYSNKVNENIKKDDDYYNTISLSNNGIITKSIIKYLIPNDNHNDNHNDKSLIFIGHSQGCITSIYAACSIINDNNDNDNDNDYKCKAIVLIAPAIKEIYSNKNVNRFDRATTYPILLIFNIIYYLSYIPHFITRIILIILLKVLVHFPYFWYVGLHIAFGFKPNHPSYQTINQYSIASKNIGWENRLIDFIISNVWGGISMGMGMGISMDKMSNTNTNPKLTMYDNIQFLINNNVKILIIHSDDDYLVPIENSYNLKKIFKNSIILETVTGVGHMPHETEFEQFTSLLQKHHIFD